MRKAVTKSHAVVKFSPDYLQELLRIKVRGSSSLFWVREQQRPLWGKKPEWPKAFDGLPAYRNGHSKGGKLSLGCVTINCTDQSKEPGEALAKPGYSALSNVQPDPLEKMIELFLGIGSGDRLEAPRQEVVPIAPSFCAPNDGISAPVWTNFTKYNGEASVR